MRLPPYALSPDCYSSLSLVSLHSFLGEKGKKKIKKRSKPQTHGHTSHCSLTFSLSRLIDSPRVSKRR